MTLKGFFLKKQNDGLRAGSVANIKNVISAIFSLAIEEEIVQANPASKIGKYIRKPEQKRHINFLAKEQVSGFLQAVWQNHNEHYPLLLCAFRTGMRMGELAGLAWEDINFEGNFIKVSRSYSHGHFSSPKSRKCRYIDMSEQLKQTLLALQSSQLQRYESKLPITKLPSSFSPDNKVRLVFGKPDGKPGDLDNFRRKLFYKYLTEADLPRIRFHDIRHTFASLLLQQGESLHYVKEQMGHASIQTTVDVYGHIVPGTNRKAVNKLDDEITPKLKLVSDAS